MVLHTVVKYFWYARLRTKNYPNFMLLLGNIGKIGLQRRAPTLGVVSYRDIVVENDFLIIENEKIGSRN